MLKVLFCVTFIFSAVFAEETTETIDNTVNLLDGETYTWYGKNMEETSVNVTAEGYGISVTIEKCNIGNQNDTNDQYLILTQGNDDGISSDVGRIFAYITTSKKLYFYSSSVLLQLKTSTALTEECKVTFALGEEADTTLAPVTTTEAVVTTEAGTSKYATVYISGKSIGDFSNSNDSLAELKDCLLNMAIEYTTTEGFCLEENITISDIDIHVLEQCSTSWPEYETCVRLVYAIPVNLNAKCSLWKGYQLTEEQLNIMWLRLADEYLTLCGLQVYNEPTVDSVITWWIVAIVLMTVAFSILMIVSNLLWKRREMARSKLSTDMDDFATDTKRVSDISMSLPDYQSTPPMFEGTYSSGETYFEGKHGTDNEGFQRHDEILNYEEDA